MFTAKRKIHNLLHNATNRGTTPLSPAKTAPTPSTASTATINTVPSTSSTSITEAEARPATSASNEPKKSLYQQPSASASLSSVIDESIRKRRKLEKDLAAKKKMAVHPGRPQTPTPGPDSRAGSVTPSSIGDTSKPIIKVGAARYAPWDRNEFLQRLETFRSVSSWSSKPERINEVAWAKRGWICMQGGKNRVRCASHCGGEVVVKVEYGGAIQDDFDEDEEDQEATQGEKDKLEALVTKYEELIVEGHEEACLWKKRGCDKAIYRLPLQPATEARTGFYARYKSLTNLSDDQMVINLTKPAEVDTSALILPEEITKDPLKQNALVMAMFGWAKDDNDAAVQMVKCDACFRRLGLWLFVKRPGSADDDGDEFSSMSRLNVVEEHRDYCPWVSAASQTGDHTGWETLLRILKSNIPGNLVAAASPPRVQGQTSLPGRKTEEEHRKDDETRWKRLKDLRKSYGSSFAMNILGGKTAKDKRAEKPAKDAATS